MNIEEQIKEFFFRQNIIVYILERKVGIKLQNFNTKLQIESLTAGELKEVANTVGCNFERYFVLANGDRVEIWLFRE